MPKRLKANRGLMALAGLCIFLSMGACESSCRKTGSETGDVLLNTEGSSAAASINGKNITKAELDAIHKRSAEKYAKAGQPLTVELDRKVRAGVLRRMIDDEIIRQKAESEGIKIDRFERVKALEAYKEKMGGQKLFSIFLETEKISEEQVQKLVLADLLREKLIQKLSSFVEPTEEELKKYLEANQVVYNSPEKVRARHILLKLNPNDPKEKEALVQKKASEILKEAREQKVPFEQLVQKYSEGSSVKQGGDLGFFTRGRMVKTFEDAAFNAPLKKAVGPIKTDYGYHIIYVEEKTPMQPSTFEEVRDRLAESFKRKRLSHSAESIIRDLRKDAKIKIFDYSLTDEEYRDISDRAHAATREDIQEKAKAQ